MGRTFPFLTDPLIFLQAMALTCAFLTVAGLGEGECYICMCEGTTRIWPEKALNRPRYAGFTL